MRIKQLFEKHYRGILYHSTKLWAARSILENDMFRLSSINTDVSPEQLSSPDSFPETKLHGETMQNKKFNHYISMSRSKMNSYRELASQHPDTYNVTFVIDGSKYSNKKNVKIMPVDYFNYATKDDKEVYKWEMGELKRKSEAEERIWSTSPIMKALGILEVHCLNQTYDLKEEFMPIIIEECKKKQIPLFSYIFEDDDDLANIIDDYLRLDKRKANRLA